MLRYDTTFNEAFIRPICGLYAESALTVDEFKERHEEICKHRWVDMTHGSDGHKIYELFHPNNDGEIIKEGLQEWLCDNRLEITTNISIALRNHERSYAEWFKQVDDNTAPDELALYCLSRKIGVHTCVFNKRFIWTTLANYLTQTDEEIMELCGVILVFLGPNTYGVLRNI